MSFALPSAFWLAWCAIPIIAFYFFKVRWRQQPVSTNLFWRSIHDEQPSWAMGRNWRDGLSLLMQLFVLSLLLWAAADPFLTWQRRPARRIVAVIDRSASMQATDITPSRFAAAVDSARDLVHRLQLGDEMAIVAAGPQADVVLGMTGLAPSLSHALSAMSVAEAPAAMDQALSLARRILDKNPNGEIIIFSDGCIDSLDPQTMAAEQGTAEPAIRTAGGNGGNVAEIPSIEWRIFAGPHPANVGITQFQARRSLVDPIGYDLSIAVTNASDRATQLRLEIEREGVPIDVLPLRLAPQESWRRTLQKTSIEGGRLTGSLVDIQPDDGGHGEEEGEIEVDLRRPIRAAGSTQGNDLKTDDVASTFVPARQAQHVLLITDGNPFLEKVLQANPLVQCQVLRALPSEVPPHSLVILHRHVPANLPNADLFVIDPVAGSSDWSVGDVLENPMVTYQRAASPLMTHVHLDHVWLHQARQITFQEPPEVLASTVTGDIIYAEWKRATGKGLILTADLNEGDLPFRTAFPILMANALRWFRDDVDDLQGDPSRSQALAQESDLRPRPAWSHVSQAPGALPRRSAPPSSAAHGLVHPLWFYVTFAAVVMVVVEWCLYQRRVIA